MNIPSFPFQVLDWSSVPKEVIKGETGLIYSQVQHLNNIRIRMVEYTSGYKADHWCNKGHIIYCIEGEMETELKDGRKIRLSKGMTYFVGDDSDAHRTSSEGGCKLFIVD